MDPDFGIKTWYLKPTFYAKILWVAMSAAAAIYVIVLMSMDFQEYYKVVIGSGSGTLALFIFFFILISVAGNLLYYYKVLPKFGKYVLYVSSATTAITLLFAIIYAAVFGNNENLKKTENEITNFNFNAKTENERRLKKWFQDKYGAGQEATTNYVKNRTTRAGSALIGLLLTWFLLQCALLFIFLQERDYEGLGGNTDPIITQEDNKNSN